MSKLSSQHFIPEFFLKNFVDPKLKAEEKYQLWLNRRDAKPVLSSTRKLARKKHIYSTRKSVSDPYNKQHEQLLDKVESIAAPVISKIILTEDLQSLDQRERDDFAIFLILLAERNPVAFSTTDSMLKDLFLHQYRKVVTASSDAELRQIYEKAKQEHESLKDVSFEEAKKVMIEGPKEENLTQTFSHGIESMWMAAEECSKFMHLRKWQLISSGKANKEFWLSDNPVLKIRDVPEDRAFEIMQGGWGIKDLEIALPLSPFLCFYAADNVDSSFHEANSTEVDAINWWSIAQSTSEIYSTSFFSQIWDLENESSFE